MNFEYEWLPEDCIVEKAFCDFVHPYDPHISVCPTDGQDYFKGGWSSCKNEVLKILSKPSKNLDLSEDYCDERYIEEIKKL